MMLYLCLYIIMFMLPIVYCENVSFPVQGNNSKPLNLTSNDTTKLKIPSEGGTLLASTPDLSLTKDKQLATLLSLDGELEKPKETSIKARKGVDGFSDIPTIQKTTAKPNITAALKTSNESQGSHPLTTKITANANATQVWKNTTLDISKKINSTEAPKKPTVLSYEALVNADKNNHDELKIVATNPSAKTLSNLAKNQIPSPNEDAIVKVYPSRANSHPGMIMPIVITILVVPMFAIVGYMALKRGQEAWKNRHYKRMDFLLDGMYND